MSSNAQDPLTESERVLLYWIVGLGALSWGLCLAGVVTAMLML